MKNWILRKILVISLVFLIFLFFITLFYISGSLTYLKVKEIVGETIANLIASYPVTFLIVLVFLIIAVSYIIGKAKNKEIF